MAGVRSEIKPNRFASKGRIAPPSEWGYAVNMQTELQNKWQQVLARDARQDGRFVFAVRTTGVFCRPSCPSRRPRRDSVEFFADPDEAETSRLSRLPALQADAGLRAGTVRAAGPAVAGQRGRRRNAGAAQQTGGAQPVPSAAAVQACHRTQPARVSVGSPHAAGKTGLRKGDDVTTALYDAGFGSPSRLYEKVAAAARHDAGRPIAAVARARRSRYAIVPTPLGRMLVAATDRGLCAVRFGESVGNSIVICGRNFMPQNCIATTRRCGNMSNRWWRQFAGDQSAIDLPLDVRATAFQQKVWDTLRQIPRGETRSYTEVAREIGSPAAVRAVAHACASNPSRDRGAVPSRSSQRRRPGRIPLGDREEEEAPGQRACELLNIW